ncbi:PD-(D/E)XK nuclease family protein, partial [Cutibacterium acnes subsp. acnes]|nr:PD-(D/E)XK nuclease family protein [Cutibacterium acnes subsp. acnes]
EWQRSAELADAKAAVQRFDGWLQLRNRQLIGTEVRVDGTITVPSGTARVRGSIDRLERDAEGAYYVVDLKTGTSQSDEIKQSHRLQIGVYQA